MPNNKKREKLIKERVAAKVAAKLAELQEHRKEKTEKVKAAVKKRASKRATGHGQGNTVTENRLELLITIVDRAKGEYYVDLLQSFDVNLQFVELGYGTADANALAAFGLSSPEKAVIFSVIQESKLKDALHTLEDKFRTIKNGKGIAYTVPLSGVIGTLIFRFLSNNRMSVKEANNGK